MSHRRSQRLQRGKTHTHINVIIRPIQIWNISEWPHLYTALRDVSTLTNSAVCFLFRCSIHLSELTFILARILATYSRNTGALYQWKKNTAALLVANVTASFFRGRTQKCCSSAPNHRGSFPTYIQNKISDNYNYKQWVCIRVVIKF